MARDPILLLREDEWVRLRAAAGSVEDPWDLLRRNARRRGPARFVLGAGGGAAPFATELVLDLGVTDGTPTPSSARARLGLAPGAPDPACAGAAPDWPALVEAAGWRQAPRGDDRLAIELDAPGHRVQARLVATDEGATVSVALARAGAAPPVRRAIACYVLRLTAWLRLVRAAAGDPQDLVVLEVRVAAEATARELDLALSALSVGFRLAGREVRALTDETLATWYLEHLNPARIPCDSTKEAAFSCST